MFPQVRGLRGTSLARKKPGVQIPSPPPKCPCQGPPSTGRAKLGPRLNHRGIRLGSPRDLNIEGYHDAWTAETTRSIWVAKSEPRLSSHLACRSACSTESCSGGGRLGSLTDVSCPPVRSGWASCSGPHLQAGPDTVQVVRGGASASARNPHRVNPRAVESLQNRRVGGFPASTKGGLLNKRIVTGFVLLGLAAGQPVAPTPKQRPARPPPAPRPRPPRALPTFRPPAAPDRYLQQDTCRC